MLFSLQKRKTLINSNELQTAHIGEVAVQFVITILQFWNIAYPSKVHSAFSHCLRLKNPPPSC